MLHRLPPELLCNVFGYLAFADLEPLLEIGAIRHTTHGFLQAHHAFEHECSMLLKQRFEAAAAAAAAAGAGGDRLLHAVAAELLELLCRSAQAHGRDEQAARFGSLLSTLEQWVGARVVSPDLAAGLEWAYASLCLAVRHGYLEQPEIRSLHDPRYRRRNTRHPVAPFLPREFTHLWRRHCADATEVLLLARYPVAPGVRRRRTTRLRFARFFGRLFQASSVYLEFNLDGTFDECVREALLSGAVESLLAMCLAAERPVDVDAMCMAVSLAEEQLWGYIDLMADLAESDPTPEQQARLRQQQPAPDGQQPHGQPAAALPEWLLPSRYRIHETAPLRLKLLHYLVDQRGWRWLGGDDDDG